MTDISKESVERLASELATNVATDDDEWPMIQIREASNTLRAQAAHIAAQDAKIAKLEAAIKRQASASKTLRNLTLDEVQHLKDKDRSEYTAAKTVDSEREANAILTEELEERDAKIAKLVEALRLISSHRRRCHEHDEDMGHDLREFDLEDLKLMEQAARSTLASIGETDD